MAHADKFNQFQYFMIDVNDSFRGALGGLGTLHPAREKTSLTYLLSLTFHEQFRF